MANNANLLVTNIDGLCKALMIGKNTAYELLNSGDIDCFKIAGSWKIPLSSVELYIQQKCLEHHKPVTMCNIIDNNIL